MKGFKISSLMTDAEKVLDGTWIDFGAGSRIKIAKVGNDQYNRMMRKLGKPVIRESRLSSTEEESLRPVFIKVVARTILLGWEKFITDDEEEIQYSIQKAEELLETVPEFYEEVMAAAADINNFRPDAEEDEAGN